MSDVEVLAAGEMAGVDMTLCRERQMEAEKEEELHVMGRSGGVGVPIGGAIVLRGRGGVASRSHFERLRRTGAAAPGEVAGGGMGERAPGPIEVRDDESAPAAGEDVDMYDVSDDAGRGPEGDGKPPGWDDDFNLP